MADPEGKSAGSTGRNHTIEGPAKETDNKGVIIGSTAGGVVFLALLIAAIVLLIKRYGSPSKRRIKRAMKSSLKDAEKNGSLRPVYREPAFSNPHTRAIESITGERVEVAKPPQKTKGVFGAYYSASNEEVDLREVDVSVYQDPTLNMALARGRSTKSKHRAVQKDPTYVDRTGVKVASFKNDNFLATGDVTRTEEYADVGPGESEMINSGLPDERTAPALAHVPNEIAVTSHLSQQENVENLEAASKPHHFLEGISSESYNNVNAAFVRDDGNGSSEESSGQSNGAYADSSDFENIGSGLPEHSTAADVSKDNLVNSHGSHQEIKEYPELDIQPHLHGVDLF